MGYDTKFRGQFSITPGLRPHHLRYLQKFNEVRHVKREVEMLKTVPDPLREAVGLPIGEDGVFFVGGSTFFYERPQRRVNNRFQPMSFGCAKLLLSMDAI